jgi:hypothetical protein
MYIYSSLPLHQAKNNSYQCLLPLLIKFSFETSTTTTTTIYVSESRLPIAIYVGNVFLIPKLRSKANTILDTFQYLPIKYLNV